MRDALATILACADAEAPRLSASDVATWAASDRDALQRPGILVQGPLPESIPCPGCHDGHAADVIVEADDYGVSRYVMCPEAGRVIVTATDLCEWTIDTRRLVRHLRDELELKGPFHEVVPQRLWRLGGVVWERVRRTVYFAVGLGRNDAATVASCLGPGGSAVAFVPMTAPSRELWQGLPPAVVALRDTMQLESGAWTLDVQTVLAVIREADQLNKATREGLIADPKLRRVVGAIASTKKVVPDDKNIIDAINACNGNQSKAAQLLREWKMPLHPGTLSRRLKEIRRKQAAEGATLDVDRGGASFSKGFTGRRQNNKKI